MFAEYDVVSLIEALPPTVLSSPKYGALIGDSAVRKAGLPAGTQGTIVLTYPAWPSVYEVEFTNGKGDTIAIVTVRENEIRKVVGYHVPFEIRPNNPKVCKQVPNHAEDLAAAIEALFCGDTEDAHMIWNDTQIYLSYKYDLSVLIDDLLPLLDSVISTHTGARHVYWGSNTFRARWDMQWADQGMQINAHWESVTGSYQDWLNKRSTVEVEKLKFFQEWQVLLHMVLTSINKAHLVIENEASLHLLRRIDSIKVSVDRQSVA